MKWNSVIETVDNYHTNAMNMQNVSMSNRISEEVSVQGRPQSINNTQQTQEPRLDPAGELMHQEQKHVNEVKRESEGKFIML